MKWKLRYHDLFQQDVDSYIDWFDEALAGLGAEFAQALADALTQIADRLQSCALLFEGYRRVLMLRFRVVVPFLVDADVVYVAGVVHAGRDLRAWLRGRTSIDDE